MQVLCESKYFLNPKTFGVVYFEKAEIYLNLSIRHHTELRQSIVTFISYKSYKKWLGRSKIQVINLPEVSSYFSVIAYRWIWKWRYLHIMVATVPNVTEKFSKQLIHYILSNNHLCNYNKTASGSVNITLGHALRIRLHYSKTLRILWSFTQGRVSGLVASSRERQ